MRIAIVGLLMSLVAVAADPAEKSVAETLRGLLIKKLPNPALNSKNNWDHQEEFIVGYDFKREGPLKWQATPQVEKRNHGHWTHLIVTIPEPEKNFTLELSDLAYPEPGKIAFTAKLRATDVHLKLFHQSWRAGVRIFSNETRATCVAAVHLECVLEERWETKPGNSIPELVLKLKVAKANLYYDKLKVEHTLGVGGDAAKIIGDATHKLIGRLKPDLEKEMINKANAAIVKAANDKEVRVGLSGLLKK